MNAKAASALLVAALVSSSAFVGAAAAAPTATLEIEPSGSDAGSATYAATVGVGEDDVGALDSFEMDLDDTGVAPSSVSAESVVVAGIDRGGDRPGTEVDVSVREDVDGVSVNRNTVEVVFDGTNDLRAGDELVVVIEGLPTPAPGEYTVPMGLNSPGERALLNASVTVAGSGGAATGTGADGSPATDGPTAGGTETPEEDGAEPVALTDSPVPGFGPVVGAVAVLSAAAWAARVSRRR